MTTTVVNLYSEKADVIIDRRSRWGNPFKIRGGFDRKAVLEAYGVWLGERMMRNPNFLDPLRGKRLGCWCKPLACHGDVIVEMLEGGQ